jgi:hypothetical protein
LPVQIRHFDIVIVRALDQALLRATDAHDSEGLDQLTAKSTGADHEGFHLLELLLNLLAVDADLIIVAAIHWLAVDVFFPGQSLEDVVMKPLLQGRVLAGLLHDLLSDDATEERSHWRDGALREADSILDDFFLDLDVSAEGLELGSREASLRLLKAGIDVSGSRILFVGLKE